MTEWPLDNEVGDLEKNSLGKKLKKYFPENRASMISVQNGLKCCQTLLNFIWKSKKKLLCQGQVILKGQNIYLKKLSFYYLSPGAWESQNPLQELSMVRVEILS